MPIRNRNGKLQWRFWVDSVEYAQVTDLADTARNRIKAQRLEAEARRLVLEGRSGELRLQIQPFNSAAEAFERWAEGEYSSHPASWRRLKVSLTSAKVMFGKRPLSSINRGDIEDYKAWRRKAHQVREITLRHDLHALSLLLQYAQKHNWCKTNPVREVKIPSDQDAVRINVLSRAQEEIYFAAIESLRMEKAAAKRTGQVRGLQDLKDLHRLMLLQGCRPEELRQLRCVDVDLEHSRFRVYGKSAAANRWLKMREESREILARRYASAPTAGWLFPSHKNPGQHIGPHQRLHNAVVQRATVHCVPYDFRHTFASRAANDEGVPLGILVSIMGHANLRSIMKYVHTSQHQMDRAMVRLDTGQPGEGQKAPVQDLTTIQ
jgi:integrase